MKKIYYTCIHDMLPILDQKWKKNIEEDRNVILDYLASAS